MSSWEYNCPQFVDFGTLEEDDVDVKEEYFDVDHEFPSSVDEEYFEIESRSRSEKEMTLQAPANLKDVLMAGMASIASSPSRKRHSHGLRKTSTRQKDKHLPGDDGGASKKQNTGSKNVMAPLILHKSASRLRSESADRSLSMRRQSPRAETRKRHASETRKEIAKKQSKAKKPALTKVEPFHFATDSRIKGSNVSPKDGRKRKREEIKPFVSLAEQVLAFQNHLPDRFKTAARSSAGAAHNVSLRLTRPLTPNLRTNMRSRPTCVVSQEQKEEEELKEMKSHQFHATPFDPRILIHTIGIPMVKSKTPTKPINVSLATNKRASVWKKPDTHEEVFRFKAKPAPASILKGPVVAKHPAHIPSTEPKSPAFALKLRHTAWQKHQEELATKEAKEEVARNTRARKTRSGPPPQSPFQKPPTRPVPFSFHEHDVNRFARKEAKIKVILEKENKPHLFHANPMPSPSPAVLPPKPEVTVTQPEPFKMLIDQRGQKRAEQWQQQMEEEVRQMKEAMQFKAQPCTVVSKVPFVPERNSKPLTESTGMHLNTEKRAAEREQYEEKRRQTQAEVNALKQEIELEKEREEQRELSRLRMGATHKAQPAPKFNNPVRVKPSEKPLTLPQSPRFSGRLRSAPR